MLPFLVVGRLRKLECKAVYFRWFEVENGRLPKQKELANDGALNEKRSVESADWTHLFIDDRK
jgi:hypothetical protein